VEEVSGWKVQFYRKVADREKLTAKATALKMKVVTRAMKWNILVCGDAGPTSEQIEAIQASLSESLAVTPAQFHGLLERLMKESKCTAASIETKTATIQTRKRKGKKKMSDDRPRSHGSAGTSNRTHQHLFQAKDRGLILFSCCPSHGVVVIRWW